MHNASPALAAFLRGIGRRVLLFADLQAGPGGDAALDAVLHGFVGQATGVPMSRWPERFWRHLLASPALRADPAAAMAAATPSLLPPALMALEPGPRVAVLLWLVAGLDEDGAAAALGVEPATWRLMVQRAAPRDASGGVDAATWHAWTEAVREAIRQVPAERLAWWERQCDAALQPAWHGAATEPETAAVAPRWVLPLLWSGLALCLIALVASFIGWPSGRSASADASAGRVRGTPLAPAEAPAATFDADFALRSHRDAELLADGDESVLRDLDFHAWHAAGLAAESVDAIAAVQLPPVPMPERIAAWQALPAQARALLRERWDAWQNLPQAQQAAILDAAATFDALAPEAQQALRLEFAGLQVEERRGWLLGPRLGAAWPRLQPLLMLVPSAEREPLLVALHELSPLQLDDLATLAQRTPPQERDALRRELLSTAQANRTAWLRERLRQ
ncbi:MAG: DUF3106 domain-containing protein [Pseudomonadota bacterium]|nr:DUF3106 domain-containing protein [Pseudomonadota bacterium]